VILTLLTAVTAVAGLAQDSSALREADRAFGADVARRGLTAGVAERGATDVVVLYAGAPVVVGRDRAVALLRAQPLLDSLALTFHPLDLWISAAGDFGVSHGTLGVATAAAPGRQGTYIAGWRRDGGGWRLAGLMVAGLAPPDRTVLRDDPTELAPLPATGPAASMIRADQDFSALAGREGAQEAFRAFAAPDAVVLGPGGPRRGPEAVAASIGSGPPADWRWHPVAARIAESGDLGFTVGQAVIQPRAGGDPALSKYLTVWRRQADGSIRFLTDGGNARPRP
jgi:ketosteroid isomerase-like protein